MVSCVLNHRARWRQANSGYNCELAGLITAGACAGCCRYKNYSCTAATQTPFRWIIHSLSLCWVVLSYMSCCMYTRVGVLLAYPTSVSARCSCVRKVVLAVNLIRCVRVLCLSGVGWGCYAAACNINVNRHAVMRHFMHNMSPMFTQRFMLFVDSWSMKRKQQIGLGQN